MTPLESATPKPAAPNAPAPDEPAAKPPLQRTQFTRKSAYLIAAAACAAALLFFVIFRNRHGAVGDAAAHLPIVAVTKVSRENLSQSLTISAEFHPYQQVALHAKIAGYLQSIAVDIGDHVREGQELARLDVPELKDDLAKAAAQLSASQQEVLRAEANYNEAHLACSRLQQVAKVHPKLVADQELETAQTKDASALGALAVAQQRVRECEAELSKERSLVAYATITAPFDGVITKRNADPGALIQAGTSSSSQMPVVEIAEDKRLRLVFPVPESAVPLVNIGAPVHITVGAVNSSLDGKVSRFSGKVDRATRTMSTEVDIDNGDWLYTPGMYASATIVMRESKGAITVPVQAIAVGEKPKVFVVNASGVVERRAVKLGLETPSKDEVVSGLKPGEMVIVGSRSGIQPGQKVTPKLIEIASED